MGTLFRYTLYIRTLQYLYAVYYLRLRWVALFSFRIFVDMLYTCRQAFISLFLRLQATPHLLKDFDITLKHKSYLIQLYLQVLVLRTVFKLVLDLYNIGNVSQPCLSYLPSISQ
jgi:hypothetical protein